MVDVNRTKLFPTSIYTFKSGLEKHHEDFLFLDPPYYLDGDSKMFKGMYPNCNFAIHHNNFDHIKLAEILAQESSPEVQTIGLKSLSQIGFAAAELLPLLKQALDSELKQLKQVALSGILSL